MDIHAYTQRARAVIQSAQTDALTRDHQQIVPAHIMTALLSEKGGLPASLLQMAGVNGDTLKREVEAALSKLPQVQGGSSLSLSSQAAKIFANSEKAAKTAGDAFVTLERLTLAAVLNADKALSAALTAAGVDKDRLTEAIKSVRKDGPVTSDAAEDQYDALTKYARDLTDAARKGKLDPVIGRDEEIRRTMQSVSPALVKPPLLKALPIAL